MWRKLLLANFILMFVVIIAVVLWLPTKIKSVAEDKASAAIQGQVQIQDLKIHWGLPIGVELLQIQIEGKDPAVKGQIDRIKAQLNILNGIMQIRNPILDIAVTIEKADLNYLLGSSPSKAQAEQPLPLPANQEDFTQNSSLKDLRLNFTLNDASIQVMKLSADNKTQEKLITIKETNLELQLPSLKEAASLNFSGLIEPPTPYEKLSVPVQLQTQILLRDAKIQVEQSKLSIFGFVAELKGAMDLAAQSQNWVLKAQNSDLAKIPAPTKDLPLTKWQGQLDLNAQISKASATAALQAKGHFNLQNFQGQVQWQMADVKANGLIKAEIQSQFDYAAEKLNIPSIKWDFDLTQTAIQYKDLFEKPQAIPLLLAGEGRYQDLFQLDSFKLSIGKLIASAKGQLSPDKPSNLQFEIAKTSLNGLEKMFPPIRQFPLQGEIAGYGQITGLVSEPKKMSMDVKDLKLRQVQGRLNWQSADKAIALSGPFSLNADGSAKITNMQPKDTNFTFQIDLTGAAIAYKDLFKKSAGQLLKADMKTSGSLNTENPMQSNLKVSGLVSLGLEEYAYKGAAPAAGAGKEKTAVPPAAASYDPSPFVESNPIIDNAQVKLNVNIKRVLFKDLVLNDVRTDANINKGLLISEGRIGQVFNGTVNWNNVSVPLTKSNPKITGTLKTNGVAIEQALAWSMPQWKDLAEGKSQIDLQFDTFMPSHPDFMKMLKAKGTFALQDGVMKTLQFQQMAAEQLSKIPGVGSKFTPRNDKIHAKINAAFDLQNGQMKFNPLDAITPEKDQLTVSGSMNLDKTLDLNGNLFLQNPPVGGSFLAANVDSSGRLQIPLMIKGSLLSPQMSFATETIKAMLGKTLDYEKNKAVKSVKESATKELEKAAKDQLKKILGN